MSITNNGRGPAILVFLLLLFGLNATAPGDETTTLAQWSAETWDADISDMWLSGGGNLVNLVRPLVDFDKSQEKTLISAMSDYEIPRTDIDLGRCGVWSKAYSSGTLKLDATMNLGGAAAVLSTGFAPRIETSMATDELHGGQTLVLQTYANVQRSATSITSSFSDIDFGLSGQLASSVRIRVEADGPGIGVDTNILDTSFDTGYDSILTVNHSANEETPLPGGDGILGWAGAAILSSKTGISGTVGKDSATGASVNDAFSATDQSTFVISRQYEYDNMVNAVMDIDSLLPGPPVVGWGFDNVTAGGFTVGGNIVDAKLDYSASVNQNVDASVYAEGRLTVGGGQTVSSYEVYYTNADGDSTLRSSGTNAATIDFHLGDRVEITMPQGDLELTPSYRVAGTLDHTVGIEESFEAQLRLLTLTLGTPKIKLWNGFKVLAWTVGGKTLSWGGIDWEAASLTQSLAGDVTEFQTSMPIGFDSTAFVNAGSFTLTGKAWTIQGNHSFTTDTTIGDDSVYRIGGQLNISGSSDVTVTGTGNVSVDDSVVIGAGSTLTIDDGKLIAGGLDNSAGGTLDFEDGDGTLIIQGGAFDPGKTNLTLGATWSHAWGGTASSPSPTLILAAGSDAEFSGDITVGKEANGDLQVLGGASLKNANTYIGRDRGTWTGPWPNYYEYNWWSTGTAAVDGEGSVWESTGNFYIGGDSNNGGVGTVTVSDGGHLIVGDTLTMWYGGTLNVWDGEVTVGRLYNPGNRGTVNFSGGKPTTNHEISKFFGTNENEAAGGGPFRFIHAPYRALGGVYEGEANFFFTGVGALED
ncbi:MAG: hypothetical protein H8E53_09590, partial [Planctomycetes bacterium]|nr:hypothetical protein [Planctomycetota bacterium]